MTETHSPTGYEPKDLAENHTSFFGQTDVFPQTEHDIDSIIQLRALRLPPPEPDLDDEQIRNMLAGYTAVLTGERSTCRPITSSSLLQRKNSVKFISLQRRWRETCTQESRVKKHFPTEKAFPQDINQFKKEVKLSSGSLIRKKVRE